MTRLLIEQNILVSMRDGVRLAPDVYRLDGAPPTPTLPARTPYNREHTVAGNAPAFDTLHVAGAGCLGGRSRRSARWRHVRWQPLPRRWCRHLPAWRSYRPTRRHIRAKYGHCQDITFVLCLGMRR